MNRFDVTEAIVAAKIAKGLKWADIAKKVGQSKEWTTAALLGRGVALGMLGRHDEAIRDFNQALMLDPSYWGDTHPDATSTIATAILPRL